MMLTPRRPSWAGLIASSRRFTPLLQDSQIPGPAPEARFEIRLAFRVPCNQLHESSREVTPLGSQRLINIGGRSIEEFAAT